MGIPEFNLVSGVMLRVFPGWAVDVLILGAGFLAVAAAVQIFGSRVSAADRHSLWWFALVATVVWPVATGMFGVLDGVVEGTNPRVVGPAGIRRGGGDGTGIADFAAAGSSVAGFPRADPPGGRSGTVVGPVAMGVPGDERLVIRFQPSWVRGAVMIWLAVAAVLLGRALLGRVRLFLFRRRSRPLLDARWQELLAVVGRRHGIRRPIRLLRHPGPSIPMTWGGVRPVVLLPESADRWSEGRREAVLLHELGHIRRWDCTIQGVAEVIRAVCWFHPLVWLAVHRLRVERELACDDLVLNAGWRASDYADVLVDLARSHQPGRVGGAVSMAQPRQLAHRVSAILEVSRQRRRTRLFAVPAVVMLAAGVVLPRPVAIGQDPVAARPTVEATQPQGGGRSEELLKMEAAIADTGKRIDDAQSRVDALGERLGIQGRPAGDGTKGTDDVADGGLARIRDLRLGVKSQIVRLASMLERAEALDQDGLRAVGLTLHPEDQLLQHLAVAHAKAEVDADVIRATRGDSDPEVVRARNLCEVLRGRLDARIQGVLQGMRIQLEAHREEDVHLNREAIKAKEQAKDSGTGYDESLEAKREYFLARRDLENEKIRLDVLRRKLAMERFDAAIPRGLAGRNPPPPRGAGGGSGTSPDLLVVTVAKVPPNLLLGARPVTLDALKEEMSARVRANSNLTVTVEADPDVSFRQVVQVMNAAKAVQVRTVNLSAPRSGERLSLEAAVEGDGIPTK